MLRNYRRSVSILAVGALSKVSFYPFIFRSLTKTPSLIHCSISRHFETAVRSSESFSDPEASDSRYQLGSSSCDPRDLRQIPPRFYDRAQNPDGGFDESEDSYKRIDFENVCQPSRLNSNGFSTEDSSLHQRNNFGEFYGVPHKQRKNNWNSNGEVLQLNSRGFNVENRNNNQSSNLVETRPSNLNGFHGKNYNVDEKSNFGGVQQLNSYGNFGDNHNPNSEDGLQKGSSISSGVEVNEYYHDLNAASKENHRELYNNPTASYDLFDTGRGYQNGLGVYREGSNEFNTENGYQKSAGVVQRPDHRGLYTENFRNSEESQKNLPVQAYQQSPNAFYGYNGIGRGEFQQSNNASFGINNVYGHNGQDPQSAHHQSQFPSINESGSDLSAETGESIGFKGSLVELDECCKDGKIKEAVEVLALLRNNGVAVDLPRYLMLLQVCGESKSLDEARDVHNNIDQAMGDVTVAVNNKILDVYSKCGSMADAYQLFERMHHRNLTSWDSMISGLANNNHGEEAIDLFTEFKETGLQPDGDLFVAVFNACGVLGAVDEGMLHFQSMKVDFGIVPTMKHYSSIVDMLGRSGYLDEALEFIEKMTVEPSVDVWETLMNICRVNGYEELGKRCAEIVEQLDSSRLTEQTKLGLLPVKVSDVVAVRKDNSNLLNSKRHMHELRSGDRSHPDTVRIYEQLRALVPNLREAGYVAQTRFALHDLDQESRAEALLAHSEKLAAAYVLLTSPARSDVRIIKNLRFCNDCHEAMKIISKLTGRVIICRDAKRFHHFRDGFCSCKDYY